MQSYVIRNRISSFSLSLRQAQLINWRSQTRAIVTSSCLSVPAAANFRISGTKVALPGTRDVVGRFRDDPGHSWTVGNPNYIALARDKLELLCNDA